MAPTILVAGATGNTGKNVVETLSRLISSKTALPGYRVLALTRDANGTVAQHFAGLPHVEVEEKRWVNITPEWLRERNVERAFIASHLQTNQFSEESAFLVAALNGGVKYVVRISTNAPNVRPDSLAYYPRTHWAIEALLSTPEFEQLKWSSLQPNGFSTHFLYPAVEFVKSFRRTGKQDTLSLMCSEDALAGIIDPNDIGDVAAHLLADDDFAKHSKAKYVLNGPEDVTGKQIVELVEQAIGTKVEKVVYKDMSLIGSMAAAQPQEAASVILSIKAAMVPSWEGKCTASTTSKEIAQLGLLKTTAAETFKNLLG
ncbi:hypothetical protein G7046_g4253 [Stylonectria norvegica]|nr:hypothetical protein G7046_g4253 [Stylonectria norvegica]